MKLELKLISLMLGRHWKWIANYEHCSRGRLWIGWHYNEIDLILLQKHEHSFFFSAIYGLHTIEDRKGLWNVLLYNQFIMFSE